MDIDTIFREYSYTVRQLVKEFGLDNVSASVKTSYDTGNYDQWIEVVHVVTPNEEADPEKLTAKYKPFLSCWYEKNGEEDKFLRESGFDEFPVMAPRWDVLGEDIYGHSPAMEVLGDVKMLQKEQKKKIMAIDKMIDPPMNADIALRGSRLSNVPGDVNYISTMTQGSKGYTPAYELGKFPLQDLMLLIQETQGRIKRAFYEDLMLMFATSENSTSNMTNMQVEERHQEKLLALGPYMERLNNELLSILITRTFNVSNDRGMIPMPPEELQGQPLKIEYTSMMAQAQKLIGLNGLERLVSFVGGFMAVAPNALDKLDVDQSIDEYAEMIGAPPRAIRSDDEVAQMRKLRQQQQQLQQMATMAQPLQQGARAAKDLANTDVTNVNALTRMMGTA